MSKNTEADLDKRDPVDRYDTWRQAMSEGDVGSGIIFRRHEIVGRCSLMKGGGAGGKGKLEKL